MEEILNQEILYPEQPVTVLEKVAGATPYGCVVAACVAESNIDPMIIGVGVPIGFIGGAGAFVLTRVAVNRNIDPSGLPEISDAENEANIRNSKVAAVAAGAAGIASKYELTKFFSSGNSKELLAGIALTGAAAFWAKISLEKHRNALGREKFNLFDSSRQSHL